MQLLLDFFVLCTHNPLSILPLSDSLFQGISAVLHLVHTLPHVCQLRTRHRVQSSSLLKLRRRLLQLAFVLLLSQFELFNDRLELCARCA